jgi:hypothetical protein
MNDYIVLDGKRYGAIHDTWTPVIERPLMKRRLLSGKVNVKFGPAIFRSWRGGIHVPVTATAPYGTITDFRTTYAKLTSLSFTDHYGISYTVVLDRTIDERSISPGWDSADNVFPITISLTSIQ